MLSLNLHPEADGKEGWTRGSSLNVFEPCTSKSAALILGRLSDELFITPWMAGDLCTRSAASAVLPKSSTA